MTKYTFLAFSVRNQFVKEESKLRIKEMPPTTHISDFLLLQIVIFLYIILANIARRIVQFAVILGAPSIKVHA